MPQSLHHFAGRYRVEGILGRGGMGVVLDAVDTQTGQAVAIKVMKPSLASHPIVCARFAREARILADLDSDHVVRGEGEGTDGDLPYVVMERLEGEDLADVIDAHGALPIAAAVTLARQICAGLREVHRAGVVHRDLKPENVFIAREGMLRKVKLLDFGIAKAADEADDALLAEDASAMGTTAYMAPEQFDDPKAVDARADIWAVGVLLYELITGRRPFEGDTRSEVITQVLRDAPVPPSFWAPVLPPALDALIMTCLERDPDERFSTVEELDAALAPMTLTQPVRRRVSGIERRPRLRDEAKVEVA